MDQPQHSDPPILQNRFLRLEFLTRAGPRISAIIPAGTTQNLLARLDGYHWEGPYGPYSLLGGHRLWAAPEIPEVTYFPETSGAQVQFIEGGIRLSREDHGKVHYERSIEIRLEADAPRLHLVHTLRNLSTQPLNVAPWAITVLPPQSRVRVPLSSGIINQNRFLPDRNIVFWPYDDVSDPRFTQQNGYVELHGDGLGNPFKVGVYTIQEWAAAEINGWLLVKHFSPHDPNSLLDLGANVEVYTNQHFIEFELLGELHNLQEGESVDHIETWELLPGALADLDENGTLSVRK